MSEHNILSESEQMYLLTIALLNEDGAETLVPLSRLAAELNIASVSANQMIRKLGEAGLVEYHPYKGVSLTPAGWQAALSTLRHRRLWEVFLVEHLRFSPSEAETLACRLEHTFPSQAVERLAAFLGEPAGSPQGKPIPPAQAQTTLRCDQPLTEFQAGEAGRVTQLVGGSAVRSFLAAEQVLVGGRLAVLGIGQQGAVLVETVTGSSLHLSPTVAGQIWLEKTE